MTINEAEAVRQQEARVILQQVRQQGGEPFERLKAKCRWEHMTLLAVLMEWGDPRGWPT